MNIDGSYEIIEMEAWDKDAIDLVEPGSIRIKGNRGTLHFICVDGDMDIHPEAARPSVMRRRAAFSFLSRCD